MLSTSVIFWMMLMLFPSAAWMRLPGRVSSDPAPWGDSELQRLNLQSGAHLQAGRFREAEASYGGGLREASARGERPAAVHFLNGLASVSFATFRYRQAMEGYLKALDLAEAIHYREMGCAISMNMSSLYLQMGSVGAAGEAARRGLRAMAGRPRPKWEGRLLLQLARVRAVEGDFNEAEGLFRQGIGAAEAAGDTALVARGLDYLGLEYLERGDLPVAESCLVEALRLRVLLHPTDLYLSYPKLGMLRMAQRDLRSAAVLMDRAVAMVSRSSGLLPVWRVYHRRGLVRMALGRTREAYADFRKAVELTRRWRAEVLPADAIQTSADVGLHQVYASLIEAGNALYFQTGREEYARSTFEAAEQSRAASLHRLWDSSGAWLRELPARYWDTLASLHASETALLAQDSAEIRSQARELRFRLTEMEVKAGLDTPGAVRAFDSSGDLIASVRRRLEPSEALIAFHLGKLASYRWTLTGESLSLVRLPPRGVIADRARRLREAVQAGSPLAASLGAALYADLFDGLGRAALGKPDWRLLLDDALFEVPFGALVTARRRSSPVYLAETRSLRLSPGWSVQRSHPALNFGGRAVAVGDPVYNTADPRWAGKRPGQDIIQLPRLPGSSREVQACAEVWEKLGASPLVLEGMSASKTGLRQALEADPAIVHLATHVVGPSRHPYQAFIALGLEPDARPGLLSPDEILRMRHRLGLVVLSGCGSGRGQTLPGVGLLGLGRAWLSAGAGAVVASQWPVSDDGGEMFVAFYRHLGDAGTERPAQAAAIALRRAQQDMLRSGGWRGAPKYWASYFVAGKD